jgi:hypothetical protein
MAGATGVLIMVLNGVAVLAPYMQSGQFYDYSTQTVSVRERHPGQQRENCAERGLIPSPSDQVIASLYPPPYTASARIGRTGPVVDFDESGQMWYGGRQVASVEQVGTGKGPLDDVAANIPWWRPDAKIAANIAASLLPGSEPSYRINFTSPNSYGNSSLLVLSGGPSNWKKLNQAGTIYGVYQGISALGAAGRTAAVNPATVEAEVVPGATDASAAGGGSAWQSGRYAASKGWAAQPGGYWAARQAGKDVFPTLRNSGLSGDALATEQLEFFRRGLAAGKDTSILRGQAATAGYTRYTTWDADWLAQPGAENRLQQAIQEANQATGR